MKVIVCGGRSFDDLLAVKDALLAVKPSLVIHGGAPGADQAAGRAAFELGIAVRVFPADWVQYGKSAGPRRNQEMVEAGADLVLSFPGGRGTADLVARAKRAGIPVRFPMPPAEEVLR